MALTGGNIGFTGYQQPNYAGAVEAAGLPMQAIGQAVGQAADYFKKQKESKNMATMGIKIAEAAKIMDPSQVSYYDNLISSLKDENTPVDVRGQLGASIQDLLKQNTSMRAVAVQEGQLGRMPSYLGGGYGGGQGARGAAQYSEQPMPLPTGGYPPASVPGPAGADLMNLNSLMERAQKIGLPVDKVNPVVSGIQNAIISGSPEMGETVKRYSSQLAEAIADAEEGFEPVKDKSGQALVQISEDEAGNVTRYTKTKGGRLIGEGGEVLDSQGRKIESPKYNQFDQEAIDRAIYGNGGVLPELPPETSMSQPVGTPQEQAMVARMIEEGRSSAMAQNMPKNALPTEPSLAFNTTQSPAPQQSARQGLMAKQSLADSAKMQKVSDETLTQLSPRKARLYESALNQAYQDPKLAPSQDVVDEMKQQLLMQPEAKGPQIMSESEYGQRNTAIINKAAKRVGDRSAAYTLLSRFDTAQKLANHPESYKVFGQSIPQQKLDELARSQGGVYALFNNLKGQDLVQAMRDIKAQSGTAAGMSEKETMALQRAVNDLDLGQDWKSAQSTLMRIASGSVRAGKALGLDDSIFEVMPMTQASGATSASKRQVTRAAEILDNPESTPLFRDEMEYLEKLARAKSRQGGNSGSGVATPTTSGRPEDVRFNLNKQFGL
jgi:hypothetical protein